ncbi:hypothetical protein GCM10010360_58940 [Streptomyces nogalater]
MDTLLRAEADEGTYPLVVESQGKTDERKRGSWLYYLRRRSGPRVRSGWVSRGGTR